MMRYSAAAGSRALECRGQTDHLRPIPAQSPWVTPIRSAMAESAHSRASLATAGAALKSADISLRSKAGDPAFLKFLRFLLDYFLLDLVTGFSQRARIAAFSLFHLQDV